MRVKIGDDWFGATPDQPIMIEMNDQDKRNIRNMHPDATKYAIFSDLDERTREEKMKWME